MWVWYAFGTGEEYFETTPEAIKSIGNYLVTHNRENNLLYDFGSSQWDFLFRLLKVAKNLKTIGLERDGIKIFYARLRNVFQRNKHNPLFLKTDFMKTDISKADIIFIYVPRVLLPQLQKKLQKELKKGAIVILYKISFLDWVPYKTLDTDIIDGVYKNKIFIYQKNHIVI